jgi:hypothetical protein
MNTSLKIVVLTALFAAFAPAMGDDAPSAPPVKVDEGANGGLHGKATCGP